MKKKKSRAPIPFKKNKAKPAPPPVELPDDLKSSWEAIGAIATAHNVMGDAMYKQENLEAVRASRSFLFKMYQNMILEASKHPQSDLIPELKDWKRVRAEEEVKQAAAAREAAKAKMKEEVADGPSH